MPFGRQTLAALDAQASADIAAELPGTDPLLGVANLRILARVLAEGFHAEYAYLDYIAKQAVPFSAVDEAFEGWAALKGKRRKEATRATGTATFPATTGAVIQAETPVSRAGVGYRTTVEAVGAGGSVSVLIEADEAGSAGTVPDGSPVVLGQAVAGVGSAGTAVGVAPGVDIEEFEAFRTRVLQAYANPPQGGAKGDYVTWALEAAGVTRAWCAPLVMGAGTVVVYIMMDAVRADDGGFPQGVDGVAADETRDTPAEGDQLVVADHIYPLRPVTALVYAVAPGQNTVTFTIDLPGATVEMKGAVAAAIEAVFLAYGAPGGTVNNSTIESAISAISGTSGFIITAEACSHGAVTPGAAGNVVSSAGFLPVLGAITWTG
ncbi:MAG: baseplate J/gp47 family protein [Phenylobacterium sp.]|nr:baseplate J/gp47 family protein [Phenylobacterium sp.]